MCLSSDAVLCVAFKPDNPNILVSGSLNAGIKMWDFTSGTCLCDLIVDAGANGVCCITFNGTGDTIVAGCDNGNIFLIDTAGCHNRDIFFFTADSQVREPPLRVNGSVSSLHFSPCGTKIAATSNRYRDQYQIEVFILNPLSGDWEIGSEPPLTCDRYDATLPVCGHFTAKCFNTLTLDHAD